MTTKGQTDVEPGGVQDTLGALVEATKALLAQTEGARSLQEEQDPFAVFEKATEALLAQAPWARSVGEHEFFELLADLQRRIPAVRRSMADDGAG